MTTTRSAIVKFACVLLVGLMPCAQAQEPATTGSLRFMLAEDDMAKQLSGNWRFDFDTWL